MDPARITRALPLCALMALAAPGPATPPPAAAVTGRDLVTIVDIDSLSISPDGRTGLFRTEQADPGSNSYDLRWHSVDLRTGAIRDLGSGGMPVYLDPGSVRPESVLWLDDGTIVYRALVDGAIGLWRAGLDGSGPRPLVVRDENIDSYALGGGGKEIIYTVAPSRARIRRAEQQEYDSGILIDSTIDLGQPLFRGGSVDGRAASQRLVGYWYDRGGLLWKERRQRRILDLATGIDRIAGPPESVPAAEAPLPRPGIEATSAGGDVANASWEGGKGRLTATMADGARRVCSDALCASRRVSALVWRPGTRDLLVTFIDRFRRQSLYLWRIGDNRLQQLAGADGLLSGGRRNMFPCAVGPDSALCVAASSAAPPKLERIDLGTGARQTLFDPNARLRARYVPRVRFLRWGISDGREATGVLMQPAAVASGPMPLYVNYYACEGFLRGGEGDEWPIPELLQAGIAVVCVNAVPSTGPQDAIREYRTGLAAVESLIDTLASEGIADRAKVAMGGLSFGSEVAMWIATHSHLLAAVSIASAQLEPASYWMSAMPGSDQPDILRRVWRIGPPEETPQRWDVVAPARNVARISAPILFQLPEQEARRIPELYARLAKAGVPTELYAFPDEAHIKVQPRHRLAVYERNLDWFRYWLQDHKDPDPAKAAQYARWDRLKAVRPAPHSRSPSSSGATDRARPAR